MDITALSQVLILSAVLHVDSTTPSSSQTVRCDPARTLRVLFIGNSYTYVNNVPRLVDRIAASLPGPCVTTEMIASGGATLAAHWAAESAAKRIRSEPWTFVVLQDQSAFGEAWWVDGRPRVGDSSVELAESASRFAKAIKAAKATPVLLSHWSDDGAPARDQQAIDYAFAETARATGSALIPVGDSIKRMRADSPEVTPYFSDGHHLSPAGSYLQALVLYAALADHSPVGALPRVEGPAVEFNQGTVDPDSIVTLVDIPDRVAAALQRLAATVRLQQGQRIPAVRKPTPLAAELPTVPATGDPLNRETLGGQWSGASTVLPTPSHNTVAVELTLPSENGKDSIDGSLSLRDGLIEFSGPATLRFEGAQAVVTGTVTPHTRIGRTGPPVPLAFELRAVLHAGVLSGVARVHQPATASAASFDAVGRFDLHRVTNSLPIPPRRSSTD